eukprot:scaffold569_cov165-Amphora_coffeaeformis.AAC.17
MSHHLLLVTIKHCSLHTIIMRYNFLSFIIVFLFHVATSLTFAAESLSLVFRLAASADDVRLCQAMRHQIFVQEQKVPADTELDGKDDEALHIMCSNAKDGTLVATGRCVLVAVEGEVEQQEQDSTTTTTSTTQQQQQLQAVLGRIAVHADYRGRGIGQQVVKQLEQQAAQRRATRVTLTPHSYLYDFYARLGYQQVAGTGLIPVNEHCTLIQMEKWLK